MTNWQQVKLCDALIINPIEKLSKGTIAKKVSMERLRPFCRDVLEYEFDKFSGGSKFRNKDTIMARITPCLENGKRAQINMLEQDEIGFGSTEFIIFREKENISNSNFIYYLICSDLIREPAIKSMVGSSGRQRVQIDVLKELIIPLPPIDVQKKIAGVLGALDDKIELNNKINNNLEQQAQALFKQYFPDIISGNKTIGDYLSPKRGKNLLSKYAVIGGVPVIAGGLSPATYHNQANTAAPVITISASGANAGYVNLWHIPVWSSDSSFIDTSITPYVYFWYIVLKIRQQEIFEAQTGSAQPHIYPQHIENMPIKEINLGLVKKYNEDATPLYMLIGHNQQENTRLMALRDALLPKLMSGEIDVSNVDISALTSTDKLSFTGV